MMSESQRRADSMRRAAQLRLHAIESAMARRLAQAEQARVQSLQRACMTALLAEL